MNLTLENILSYFNIDISYDNDFNKKLKNGCYKMEREQLELESVLEFLGENNYLDEIIKEIRNIKKDKLFNSANHGYHHTERVILNGFLIGKLRNIDEIHMKILMDACKYNDCGRLNDFIDDAHGLVGSNKIQNIIKDDPFYQNKHYLNILKCLVDCHSTNDSFMDSMLETYDIEDKESTKEILRILKDADGLDRVRLSMGSCFSELDINFLRTEEAKSLIKFSHQLNELYLYSFKKISQQDELDRLSHSFEGEMYLHGIGYDFFKLESILKDGVLSRNELVRRNILSSKNFDGYNYGDYISVACYGNEYYSDNNAYNMHIRGKFAFCISDIDAFEGKKASGMSENDFRNRKVLFPIDMGVYPDERFVRNEISIDKLKNVLIPKSILGIKLTDLTYMSSSLSLETIENKINYYISVVENKTKSTINRDVFNSSVDKIKLFGDKLKYGGLRLIDYEEEVYQELAITNKNIGLLINNMYQNIFNKEDVRLDDVVKDIMFRNNLSVSMDDENYLYINLGETKKLQ